MLTAKDNRVYRSPASAEVEAELAALRERVAKLESALVGILEGPNMRSRIGYCDGWGPEAPYHEFKEIEAARKVLSAGTAPAEHCQNGRADVCLAGSADGICCAEDECDIDDGLRTGPRQEVGQ